MVADEPLDSMPNIMKANQLTSLVHRNIPPQEQQNCHRSALLKTILAGNGLHVNPSSNNNLNHHHKKTHLEASVLLATSSSSVTQSSSSMSEIPRLACPIVCSRQATDSRA